jgi:hypothetical protein
MWPVGGRGPGPLDEGHLVRVLTTAAPVAVVLVTHRHGDHTDGVRRFAQLAQAPVRAVDPVPPRWAEGLRDGDEVDVDGLRLQVVATPGTPTTRCRSCCRRRMPDVRRHRPRPGTTVVAHPDGMLGAYLASPAPAARARGGRCDHDVGLASGTDRSSTTQWRCCRLPRSPRGQARSRYAMPSRPGRTTAREVVERV